ncbi:g5178 [Coccomyxa elongata]
MQVTQDWCETPTGGASTHPSPAKLGSSALDTTSYSLEEASKAISRECNGICQAPRLGRMAPQREHLNS